YLEGGSTSGQALPPGLRESERLESPIFTPATKAQAGHDQNISRDEAAAIVGEETLAELERLSLAVYTFGARHAASRGILVADTKLEFGRADGGQIVLGDEVLTPDSSRFWPAASYRAGTSQPSFDKQFVRDYAASLGWDKTPPAPTLPEEVVSGTRARYAEVFELLTGISLAAYCSDPSVVLA
ncbi:MAG: phosphoribosylaminoimidazolesuccinocarboxamide synthase, partial [Gaiellales bacterium]